MITGTVLVALALASTLETEQFRIKAKNGQRVVYEQFVQKDGDWEPNGYERYAVTTATKDQITWKITTSEVPLSGWKVVSDAQRHISSSNRPGSASGVQSTGVAGTNLVPSQMQFPKSEVSVGQEWSVEYQTGGRTKTVKYKLEGLYEYEGVDCAEVSSVQKPAAGGSGLEISATSLIELENGWLYQMVCSQVTPLGTTQTWIQRATPVKLRLTGRVGDKISLVAEHEGSTPTKGNNYWSEFELIKNSGGRFTWNTTCLDDEKGQYWTTVSNDGGNTSSTTSTDESCAPVEGATNVSSLMVFP